MMDCAVPILVATHARALKAIGLSALLHAAALAGWPPPSALEPPRPARLEPIEVALIGAAAPPQRRPRPAVPRLDSAAPAIASTRTAVTSGADEPIHPPQDAGGESCCEEPLVEARADAAALNNPKPPYPLAARRQGIEGRVLLDVHVRPDGTCAEVRIRASSGHRLLDQAALDAVRRWRFLPARRGARTVDSWVVVPIRFHLDG